MKVIECINYCIVLILLCSYRKNGLKCVHACSHCHGGENCSDGGRVHWDRSVPVCSLFLVVLVMSVGCLSLLMLVLVYHYEPGWLLYILNSIST